MDLLPWRQRVVAPLGTAMLLAACQAPPMVVPRGAQRLTPAPASIPNALAVPLHDLPLGFRAVLRSETDWRALFAPLREGAPPLDFSREMVLVVSLGRWSGTGPAIQIDSVLQAGHTLYAAVTSTTCHGAWMADMAEVSPRALLRVPGHFREVRFVEQEATIPGCLSRRR